MSVFSAGLVSDDGWTLLRLFLVSDPVVVFRDPQGAVIQRKGFGLVWESKGLVSAFCR